MVTDLFLLYYVYQLCKKLLLPQKTVVDDVHDPSLQLLEKEKEGGVQDTLPYGGISHYLSNM